MQSIPLAVLKLKSVRFLSKMTDALHAIHTACGIETKVARSGDFVFRVLHAIHTACGIETLKLISPEMFFWLLHAIHTACGIETQALRYGQTNETDCMQSIPLAVLKR